METNCARMRGRHEHICRDTSWKETWIRQTDVQSLNLKRRNQHVKRNSQLWKEALSGDPAWRTTTKGDCCGHLKTLAAPLTFNSLPPNSPSYPQTTYPAKRFYFHSPHHLLQKDSILCHCPTTSSKSNQSLWVCPALHHSFSTFKNCAPHRPQRDFIVLTSFAKKKKKGLKVI